MGLFFCVKLHIILLNIFLRWGCMCLSGKVLLLWNVRVFVLLVLLFPVSDYTGIGTPWCLLIFLLLLLSAFLYFQLRYKFCTLELTQKDITLSTGILIRRKLYIKYKNTVAVSRIYTPLSRHLGLCNPVVYCEGATFLLPPLTPQITDLIEENIKTEAQNNET